MPGKQLDTATLNDGFLIVDKAPREQTNTRHKRWQAPDFMVRLLSPLALLLIWELASQSGLLPSRVIAAPSQIGGTLWAMIESGSRASSLPQVFHQFKNRYVFLGALHLKSHAPVATQSTTTP